MELVFEAQSIDYLRPVFTKAAAQEQTQELIVPDSYPDCGGLYLRRVRGDAGKEARDGSVVVTGGVRAGLLYVPEDGTEPRALSCYLPYSIRVDDPAATAAHAAASLLPCALGGCAAHQFKKNSGARGCRLHADRI